MLLPSSINQTAPKRRVKKVTTVKTVTTMKSLNDLPYLLKTGELTLIEATRVMGLIDSYRRTLELTEIEGRLQALENAN